MSPKFLPIAFALLAVACAPQPAPATPIPLDDYIEPATREALRFAEPGARLATADVQRRPNGQIMVCGALDLAGEQLPFVTLWRADDALDEGATLVALSARQASKLRNGGAFRNSIHLACEQAELSPNP